MAKENREDSYLGNRLLKPTDVPQQFTKEEMRNMIAREEKKIIKSLGTTGAVTTILALFGITNF